MQHSIITRDCQLRLKLRVSYDIKKLEIFKKNLTFLSLTEDLRGEMMVAPAKKLEDLIHLAELCVDLLQQNEEHYAEVSQIHPKYQ